MATGGMTMEVTGIPKALPDRGKLSAMTGIRLSVTKVMGRNREAMILNDIKAKNADEVTGYMDTIPSRFGAGTYRFVASDDGSADTDIWQVKLGNPNDDSETSSGPAPFLPVSPASPLGMGAEPAVPGMADSTMMAMSQDLGGGFRYVPHLGLLITPNRQVMPWQPQQGLPGANAAPQAAPATQLPWGAPPSTTLPWGVAPWFPGAPAPAGEEKRDRALEELQRQLNEAKEQTRLMQDQAREADRRREMSEMQTAFNRQIEASNARFEQLMAKLAETSKPTGPSPELIALREQLEATKQMLAEQRREFEAKVANDSSRAEMRAAMEAAERRHEESQRRFEMLLTSMQSRTDPMLPVLTQMMQSQQQASSEVARAMQATASAQAEAAKENARMMVDRFATSTLTPEKAIQLIQMAKDRSADSEINKGMIDMVRTLFSMQQDVIQQQANIFGQANGPSWVPMVQQAAEHVGNIAKAYVTSKAQGEARIAAESAARRAQAQQQMVEQRQRMQAVQAAQAAQRAQVQAPAPAPAIQQVAPAPAASVPVASAPAPQADAAAERAAAAAAIDQRQAAAQQKRTRKAAANQQQAQAPAAQVPAPTPPVEVPAATAPAVEQPTALAVAQQPAADAPLAEVWANAPKDDVFNMLQSTPDDQLFGPFIEQVTQLRTFVASGEVPPTDAAEAVLSAREHFIVFSQGAGTELLALTLLRANQIDVLVARVLPDATPEYHDAVVKAMSERLAVEQQQVAS